MSLKKAAEAVRAAGRGQDTELVHFTKGEVAGLTSLAKAAGGKLTRNPETGLVEAGFLSRLLPTILGTAAMFIPGMQPLGAAAIGAAAGAMTNKQDPLMGAVMGGIGGYGGAGLGAGLQGVGAGAAQDLAIQGVGTGAAQAVAQGGANAAVQQGVQEAGVGALTDQGLQNMAAANATTDFMAKPFYEQFRSGLSAAVDNPAQLIQGMGGTIPALKTAGMAAAPMLYGQMLPSGQGSGYEEGEQQEYNYDAGYTGGEATGPDPSSERRWFDPKFTRMAAGGAVGLKDGGFVIPADVVSMVGNGSSDAGLEALSKYLGATALDGPGDGMSDSIPAEIEGLYGAAVARQEAYLDPQQVESAGGEAKLYELIARIRQQAHGTKEQQRQIRPEKVLQ